MNALEGFHWHCYYVYDWPEPGFVETWHAPYRTEYLAREFAAIRAAWLLSGQARKHYEGKAEAIRHVMALFLEDGPLPFVRFLPDYGLGVQVSSDADCQFCDVPKCRCLTCVRRRNGTWAAFVGL